MKRKKQNRRLNREIIVLGALCLILFLSLVFVLIWNFNLKNEIKNLNENINTLSVQSVNDFSLFVMSKVDKCEAVTLMADDKSITINNVNCN